MESLITNDVFAQLQKLQCAAINLKEKVDLNQPPEALEAWTELYMKEFEELRRITPPEVINKGSLLRHSSWLHSNAKKHNMADSYSDLKEICLTDIYFIHSYYSYYITQTEDPKEKQYDWHNIHPIINSIAKPRFDNFQFADAVEASLKEINDIIKQAYKLKSDIELDGNNLMRKAFTSSPNNNHTPIFNLADNSTESGKNIQQGYMDIFAGAMLGIRNPKAHANLNVNPDEAWEMIVLASHLMRMWDKFN